MSHSALHSHQSQKPVIKRHRNANAADQPSSMAVVWVSAPALGLEPRPLLGLSVARQLLEDCERNTGLCDLYIVCNGRVVDRDQPLQNGFIYHLEPRLRGGKGGFGSMLRTLGAQIEKTTNRGSYRDLSGRRLRNVNQEKEMGEWLKKQPEREAKKEQRRTEPPQKKRSSEEPKGPVNKRSRQSSSIEVSRSEVRGPEQPGSSRSVVSPALYEDSYTQERRELAERMNESIRIGLLAEKRFRDEQKAALNKRSCLRYPYNWLGLGMYSDDDLTDEESDLESEVPSPAPPSAPPPSPQGHSSSSIEESQSEVRGPEQPGPSSSEVSPAPSEDRTKTTGPADPQPGSRPSPSPEFNCRPERDPGKSSPSPVQMKPAESCSSPEQNQNQTPDKLQVLDLDSVSGPEDLEVLGLNVLKEELKRRGLKCGGTLSECAHRLYRVKGKKACEVEPGL